MGRTARPFLLGDSAVLPSVFLGKTFNLIFYLQQLLPLYLAWILYTFLAFPLSPQHNRFCTLHLLQDKYFLFYNPMEL